MATMVTVIRIKAFSALIVKRITNIHNQMRAGLKPGIFYV